MEIQFISFQFSLRLNSMYPVFMYCLLKLLGCLIQKGLKQTEQRTAGEELKKKKNWYGNKGNAWLKDFNCEFTYTTIHKSNEISYIIKTIPLKHIINKLETKLPLVNFSI